MRTAALFSFLVLLGFPETARSATLWTGTTVVTTASAECSANAGADKAVVPGASYFTVLRPSGVTGNLSNSYVALYDEDRAVFGIAVGGSVPSNSYAYDGVKLSGERYGSFGNLLAGQLLSYQVTPTTITTNTRRIKVQAQLGSAFMGISGCAVTLNMAVVR